MPGPTLSIPNLITLARILLVPVVVWAIASNQMLFAFLLFAAAGVSDAVDGFLAKRFGMASELGRYLDPLADKVLIVSIYVSLGIVERLPRWLVILVVSRDLLIVGGVVVLLAGRQAGRREAAPGVQAQHRGADSFWSGWCWRRSASGSMPAGGADRHHGGGRGADACRRSRSICAIGCATWAGGRCDADGPPRPLPTAEQGPA